MDEYNNNYNPNEPVAPEQPYQQPEQPYYEQPQYTQPEQPQYEQPYYQQPEQQQYEQPYYDPAPVQPTVENIPEGAPNPTNIMVFGIVSLALCWFGVTNIGSLILAIIGMKKAKEYAESGAPYSTKVKVGRILSIVGLILSIVSIVFWIVYIGIFVAFFGCTMCASLTSASGNMASYGSYSSYFY